MAIPEGWILLDLNDPFLARIGPMFVAAPFAGDATEPARFAIRIAPHHCSFAGTCHGGLISTVLDIVLGRGTAAAIGDGHVPTVTLTVDFMRAAKVGDWLESRLRILRRTRSLMFCDAVLLGPDGPTARATAVFKLPPARA